MRGCVCWLTLKVSLTQKRSFLRPPNNQKQESRGEIFFLQQIMSPSPYQHHHLHHCHDYQHHSCSYLQSAVTHDCEVMSKLCGFISITGYLWHLLVMQQNRSDISNMTLCDVNHLYGYVPNQYGAYQHNSINFHNSI